MGFVVLPALVTDISAVYDAYFAAFKDNAVTRALFPSVTEEDLTNPNSEFRKTHTAHTLEYWQSTSTQYTVKCVDSETGNVVGMALWDMYLTPSDWRKPKISWLHGKEREHAEALIQPLWDAREKLWLNERYLYCHVIAVHPGFQHKGIGKLLVEYGLQLAQQVDLPVYVESSKEATRLYEKTGFMRLEETPVHKLERSPLQNADDSRDEEHKVPLFVWVPNLSERELPKAVQLACY